MKRTKTMIALVLLFAMLLSSCGLRSPLAEIDTAQTAVEEAQEAPQAAAVAEEAAAEEPFAQPLSTVNGQPNPVSVEKTGLFAAKFEGSDVEGTAEAVDGVYRFSATKTDGEAWHVKLESNYPTVAGRDYRVTYRFRSDVAGKIKFGDFQEFEIEEGENTVTGVMIATGGTSYLDLQLGMLPPFTIDFTEVEVKEYADVADYEDALSVPVNFEKESKVYERHDQGYAAILTRSSDKVDVNYVATSWEAGIWKSRLYVHTGLIPEKGVRYRITAELTADQDFPFELLLNNGEEEKGYGALYGQSITAGETTGCEAVIVGGSEGDELVLQFSLGMVPEGATVNVSKLHIDKIIDHYTNELPAAFALDRVISTGKMLYTTTPVSYKPIPMEGFSYSGTDTVWEGHDDGYIVSLEESADSAVMKIEQAPAEDRGVWKAKLYAATGVVLEQGKTYRVSFDLKAAEDQAEYEVCFDGSSENAYGALYGRSLTAGGTDHVEYTVTPDESLGALTLRLQLGKTDSTEGNTYTFSDLKVESLEVDYEDVLPESFSYATETPEQPEPETKSVLPEDFSYRSGVNVREQHAEGYTQSLSAEGGEATLAITAAPAEGRDLWNSKLLIDTGFVPAAGVKYMVSFDLESEKDQDKIEICFDGDAENAYGVLYDRALVSESVQPVSYFFTPEESAGALVLRLQLGQTNDTTGNTVKLSKLKISELSEDETAVGDISYLTETNVREEHDHGIEQTLSASGSAAELKLSQARGEEGGVYSSRLFIQTGVTPEAGARYRVSADVASVKALDYELVCDNGGEENGYADGKRVGLHLDADGKETVTTEITAPESGCGELVLRFQLGESPADNRITVSNIRVCPLTGEAEPLSFDITYPTAAESSQKEHSFDLEANSGAEAALTGDGKSATATVTKPGEDWNVKLYAKPNLELEKGKIYEVSLEVTNADGCEVCFKNPATGAEDGYGTAKVVSGSVQHDIAPDENGRVEILLKIGNVPAGTAVTVSKVTIAESKETATDVLPGITYPTAAESSQKEHSFDLEANSGAEAALTGDGKSATATVTKPGDDWNVKLYAKPGLELEKGKTYEVSLDVTNADGCEVCFKANDDEKAFGSTTVSSGKVSYKIVPAENGVLEILLKIGNVPAGTQVTVSNLKLASSETSGVEVLPASFSYPAPAEEPAEEEHSFALEALEGAEAVLSGDGSSATVKVTKPGDDWHVKLYAKPGLELEKGKSYRVTMNVTNADGCEVCFKRVGGEEKAFGSETVASGKVSHKIVPAENGVLELVLKLGAVPADTEVTVSDIKLEVSDPTAADVTPEGFAYPTVTPGSTSNHSFDLEANNGAEAELSGDGSSATAKIVKHGDDWHVKLYAKPGVELKTGSTYQVSLDVTNADGCEVCFKANGNEEAFGKTNVASGSVSHEITPEADGVMEIILKLGALADGTEVKVSNLQIVEGTSAATDVLPSGFAYPVTAEPTTEHKDDAWVAQSVTVSADVNDTNRATASASGGTASFVTSAEADTETWKTQLYAGTGCTLEKDGKYRITANITSEKAIDKFEVLFSNGRDENDDYNRWGKGYHAGGFDGLYSESVEAGGTYQLNVTLDGVSECSQYFPLFLRLQMGCSPADNTITVSNIKVEKFVPAHDEAVPGTTTKNSFDLEANSGAEAALTGDGSSATAKIIKNGADWNIKFYVKPGVELKSGKTYLVSLNATNADGCEVDFKANGNEEAFGKTSVASGKVSYTITPETDGVMEILLKLGTLANETEVKVSGVKLQELSSDSAVVTPEGFAYPSTTPDTTDAKSFELDANSGAEAVLTGDGSSATVTVTKHGEDWNIKLLAKPGKELEKGKSYRVTLKAQNADGCDVCFKANDDEEALGKTSVASGSASFTVTPAENAVMEILLKLGALADGTEVTVSDIKLEELTDDFGDCTPTITYPTKAEEAAKTSSFKLEALEGAEAALSGDGSSATATVTKPGDDWHVKLYAMPGLELEKGKSYLVSFEATNADGCPVCFKLGDNEEGFGSTSVASGSVSYTINPEENGTMEILLKLGAVPADTEVKISKVSIQELTGELSDITPADFTYPEISEEEAKEHSFELEAFEGTEATLSGDGKSASATVTKPGDDWHVKFYAKTGVELEKGKAYRVKLDVANADGCAVCFKNAATGAEDGFGTSTVSSGSVNYKIVPEEAGTLEILLKIGNVPADTEVKITGISVSEVTSELTDVTPADLVYPEISEEEAKEHSFKLEANEGAEATLSGDGQSASATVTKPGDDWHVKFYAMPGLELEKGKTYQISLDVSGAKDCQVCYKNTANGAEDGFGTETVSSSSGTVTHVVTPEESGTLELLLKIGNVPAGTEVKVGKIEIGELTETEGENLMTSALRSWAPINCWAHEDYEASLSHKADSASIKIGKAPADGREPWKVKLFVETGAKLEPGKSYRISVDAQANSDLPFEICYNDGAEEKGVGALYELTATSAAQTVSYEVRPEKDAELILQFSLGNAEAGSVFTVSGIKVEQLEEHVEKETPIADFSAWAPVHHWADQGYKAELSNTDSSASLHISAVTEDDQADWKLKLFVETGAKLEAGKNYRVRYDLEADTGFDFNVFYNNGAEEKAVGEFYGLRLEKKQTVEHVVSPSSDAELTIQLMLGCSGAENKVTISKVQVDEILGDAPVQQHAPINFWAHEDYAASLFNTDTSASIRITKVPADGREAWKVKLFAETGAELKAGKTYRISVDTSAASELAYEICYNNVEVEKELGALYDLHAASRKQTVTFTAAPEQDAVLILQFNLGNAAGKNTFSISDIKVEEIVVTDEENLLEGFRCDSTGTVSLAADDGYITELDKADSSATLRILHAPDERNPWNVKLNVRTGLTPEKGKGYRVSFDIEAEGKQDLFEVFYDGSEEAAYGALYQQKLSEGKKTVSTIIRPGDSKGELTIQIRLGKTDGTEGNTYTVSNLKLDEVSFSTTATPETKEVAELFTHTGYTAVLEKAHDRATVRFQKTPSTGMEPWKTKLFVETGVDLKAGQKYRVSMDVKSIIPAPFEVCFNDGAEEKGVGAVFGLISIPSGQRVEYVFYAREDAHLVIQLSLGNCSAPNSVILSDVAVEEAGDLNFLSDTIYTF